MQPTPDSGRPAFSPQADGAGTASVSPVPPASEGAPQQQPAGGASRRPSVFRRVWPPVLMAVLLVVLGGLLWQHEFVSDWLAMRGYQAPATIKKLADDSTMTAYGRRLFYVNEPRVETRDAFNRDCTDTTDEVSVLGCYVGDRQGIFIYDITEKELSGVQQVTAAHEMLHQAYDRLSRRERAHVDDLLQQYAKTVTDPELLSKMNVYRETEPDQLSTEYHSIFGTEVRNLPRELELHYSRYFAKRSQVVGLYEQYQAPFTARRNKIAAYDAQLDDLKKQIDTGKADLDSRAAALKARRAEMDTLLANNSITAYNAAVPEFNRQVAAYKAAVAQVNAIIQQYNQLIEERNRIAVEEQQLQRAIDSHATSATEQ